MRIEALPVLVLNVHSRCNCRCTMCDIWKSSGVQELSERDLERQMDSVRKLRVEWVVLSGGEPMMHSNLWRLCEMLRTEHARITLLSSGLLLQRNARAISEHVDDLIVSLDGPQETHDSIRGIARAFNLLTSGIEKIRSYSPGFAITARCTVQRANFRHLTATVESARALGLDSISFLAADLESAAFNREQGWPREKQGQIALDRAAVSELEREIERLIALRECGGFIVEPPDKLRRIARHFRAYLGEMTPIAPACNAPWTSAVVEADGSVRPCFFHQPIGHLDSGRPLQEILNGPAATTFRESLVVRDNPTCRRCVCSLQWNGSAVQPVLSGAEQ